MSFLIYIFQEKRDISGGKSGLKYNPYSGSFLRLCGPILLKIRTFRLVLGNNALELLRFVAQQ